MTDQDQLNRIENKLDQVIVQTAAHSTDLAWLKRFVGALSSLATAFATYLWRKHQQ